ncbi:MAG: TatD family hydrolase [Alphaproteobacteria bacterium]|nr:TatD family hydrolase [Alphaproteobacteria bacterium]
MLIDSHCHLDMFDDSLRDSIVKNANDAGVKYMLNACAARVSFQKIIDIVEKYDCVFGAIGQHPEEAEREGLVSKDELLTFVSKSKKIIAIGETGLDYSRDGFNRDFQIENLLNHIDVARKLNLPIIIHNRDSNDDMTDILSSEYKKSPFKAIIHCFTADKKMADKMLELGFYISASGIITFKSAGSLRDVFSNLPLNRLLLETDSPYLAPVPYRGKTNEPAFVVETGKILGGIVDVSFEEISNITTENFKHLFELDIK